MIYILIKLLLQNTFGHHKLIAHLVSPVLSPKLKV